MNYLNRSLSIKETLSLQLLGMIAHSLEVRGATPSAIGDRLCLLTVDDRTKEEVLQLEADVLKCLKFEMSVPTPKCFLHRFVCVNARDRGAAATMII